jgi:hypothetical protein
MWSCACKSSDAARPTDPLAIRDSMRAIVSVRNDRFAASRI